MSQVGPPGSGYTITDFTVPETPREVLADGAQTPAPSTALVVWTPAPEPTRWQRLTWAMLGRPEPGLDGRLDHTIVDVSLITVPRDPKLASLVLDLAKRGELSVKNFYSALAAAGDVTSSKPKVIDAVRKSLRIAAEQLEARSPGAKLADAARGRLEILRRELDSLDVLRAQPSLLAQRAQGGAASLLSAFDGHHAELTTLLAGAAAATGSDADAIAIVRTGLAGLTKRREAVQTSIGDQLIELRSAQLERDAAAASAAASARVAERDAARAEEARVAAITTLTPEARDLLGKRLWRAENRGARFFVPEGAAIRPRNVLAHLALGRVDFALGPAPTLRSMVADLLGYAWTPTERQAVRDLAGLTELLDRLRA